MANDRTQRVSITNFKGIDRSRAANDSDPDTAQVLRDMVITPDGNLKLRDEYAALYTYRPSQFEHTTNDGSDERQVHDLDEDHYTYRSHRRKSIAVGRSGSTEYVFNIWVERADTDTQHYLWIQRGTRSGADIGSWTNPVLVDSTVANAVNHADDWIEASMVISGDKSTLYLVVVKHEDDAGTTKTRVITATDLYTADFPGDVTIAAVSTDPIESSTDITKDCDIELFGGLYYAFWGKQITGVYEIRYATSTDWTILSTYSNANVPSNKFSISAAADYVTSSKLYLAFTHSGINPSALYTQEFAAGTSTGDPSLIASDVYTDGSVNTFWGACFAVDNGNLRYFLYRTAAATLKLRYEVSAGVFSGLLTVTTDLPITVAASGHTAWDFVVKDKFVTVFYSTETNSDSIYRKIVILNSSDDDNNSGAFYSAELVENETDTWDVYRYFACYRRYEVNTSKRLSYIISQTDEATAPEVKYLHSDKGLFDHDFDDSVTDTGSWQVSIDAVEEPLMNDSGGTMSQILIIQCDDDRLYKRGDYQWGLLEGSRRSDNGDWNWETVFNPREHLLAHRGEARFGAGNGATNQAIWYGWIDRYFFNNTAPYHYQDHYSDYQRLPPPPSDFVSVGSIEYATLNAMYQATAVHYSPFSTDNTLSLWEMWDGNLIHIIRVFVGIAFEYDGYQESQIYPLSTEISLGKPPDNEYTLLQLTFDAWGWYNQIDTDRMRQRVTAIIVYVGERQYADQPYLDVLKYNSYRVRRITISGEKPPGSNVFGTTEADKLNGTAQWTDDGDGTFSLVSYVDAKMYQAAKDSNALAQGIHGNGNVLYESTASGTEIYTKNTFIHEGWSYAVKVGEEVYYLGIRLAGQTFKNRLMRSARMFGTRVCPDYLSGNIANIYDLDFDSKGLTKIGDTHLVLVGDHKIKTFDVSSGLFQALDNVQNLGTNAVESIYPILEGGIGSIIRGVLFQDPEGNVRIFDGNGVNILSDPVRDDCGTTYRGVAYLSGTSSQFLYLPRYRWLILAYDNRLYVYDFLSRAWLNWWFLDSVEAKCVGVDGEMWFTDNKEVFQFPATAGSDDVPQPVWRGQDREVPPNMRGIAKRAWMTHNINGTTLKAEVYRDRAASATAASTAIADASGNRSRDRAAWRTVYGQFAREFAPGFSVTTPSSLTGLEVDEFVMEVQLEKQRDQ